MTSFLIQYLSIIESTPICDWVEANIDLRLDRSSSSDKVDLDLTPYLKDLLKFYEIEHAAKMSVMGIEQTGKSSGGWKWGLLYTLVHTPQPTLIIYPSDQDAAETNQDSVLPLMESIPQLALELSRPNSKRKDAYIFSNCSVYYVGGGSDIISKPLALVIGDECDFWVSHSASVDNVKNMDKRIRTFDNGKRVLVCSPKNGEESIIWREFSDSSRGYWNLRCIRGCGNLTMRSCDTNNLSFKRDANDKIIQSSLTVICPVCGKSHEEKDKRAMNIEGGYLHENESKLVGATPHFGYQWGALSSQKQSLCWNFIGEESIRAGKGCTLQEKIFFFNSVRGLPYIPQKANDKGQNILDTHTIVYPADLGTNLKYVFMACDTQDDYIYYVISGYDNLNNSYLLKQGLVQTFPELEVVLNNSYLGRQITAGIIDYGGHRARPAAEFTHAHSQMIGYKGTAMASDRWKRAESDSKLILANEKVYKTEILFEIYSQDDRSKNYWFLPHDIRKYTDYCKHILNLQPPKGAKADIYANYESVSKKDHFFDCEKMILVLKDVYERMNMLRNSRQNAETRTVKYVPDDD